MAQPKRKSCHSRAAKRATHKKASMPAMSKCPRCGAVKLPHAICPSCGYYKDEEMIKIEE